MDKVRILKDSAKLVVVELPEGGIPLVRKGKLEVWGKRNDRCTGVIFSRACKAKLCLGEDGVMVRVRKKLHSVAVTEMAVNPVLSKEDAEELRRCVGVLDVDRTLADMARVSLAQCVVNKVDGMRRAGAKKVFVLYRHGTVDIILPANFKGSLGCASFHHVGMVGC